MNYVLGGRSIGVVLGRSAGAAFSPLALSPVLWLDASQITGLSDGAAITTWGDASGNGLNPTQSVPGSKPTYRTSILNGKPAVRFDGSDDFLVFLTPASMLAAAAKTFVFVYAARNVGSYEFAMATRVIYGGVDNSARGYLAVADTRTIYNHAGAGSGESIVAGAMARSGAHLISLAVGANGSTPAHYRNGAALTLTTNTLTTPNVELANGYTVVGRQSTAYAGGDLCELLVFGSVLSAANRQALEAYLSAKYSIALA